jgi:hypothetical protein
MHNDDYYYSESEWDRLGCGPLPPERRKPVTVSEAPTNGEQRLNKSTGEVEVYYNGMWCAR